MLQPLFDEHAMDVSLPPELESLINLKVGSERYESASHVIHEALCLMDERDQLQALHKTALREKIAAGMASLRAGAGSDGEAFLASLDAGCAQRQRPGF